MKNSGRLDHQIISRIINFGAKVLDLGCGNGELLALLSEKNNVKGQGIEVNEDAVYHCVEKGVSVFHGDIENGLSNYLDQSFDYVILNQSMQEIRNVKLIINESLRVGKNVIVGFPNFAYIKARVRLFFKGKVPITETLPYCWYDTPNVHFLSLVDFESFCEAEKICILARYFLGRKGKVRILANLFAVQGIYLITKED